jgi:hypothetical protein
MGKELTSWMATTRVKEVPVFQDLYIWPQKGNFVLGLARWKENIVLENDTI